MLSACAFWVREASSPTLGIGGGWRGAGKSAPRREVFLTWDLLRRASPFKALHHSRVLKFLLILAFPKESGWSRARRDSASVLCNPVAPSVPVPASPVADDSWFSGGFMGTFPSRRSPSPHPLLPSFFCVCVCLCVSQIPIIIPCHRVICSSGQSGNYGGGNLMKEWLLSHEKLQKEKLAY